MSLYTIRNESEWRWPKNCPWIIDEYFRTNLRYLKLFFSEYVVWPFGMIPPICRSSEPGGMWPTIYTWKDRKKEERNWMKDLHTRKKGNSYQFHKRKKKNKKNEKGRNESFSIKKCWMSCPIFLFGIGWIYMYVYTCDVLCMSRGKCLHKEDLNIDTEENLNFLWKWMAHVTSVYLWAGNWNGWRSKKGKYLLKDQWDR